MHSNLFSIFPEICKQQTLDKNPSHNQACAVTRRCDARDACECVLLWFLDAGHPVFDELWFRLNERILRLDLGQE